MFLLLKVLVCHYKVQMTNRRLKENIKEYVFIFS